MFRNSNESMNRSREYRFETGFENNRENREDFLICEIETAREMTKARRNIGRWIELATAQLKRSAFFPLFFSQRRKEKDKARIFSRQKTAPLAICSRDICTLIRGTFVRGFSFSRALGATRITRN